MRVRAMNGGASGMSAVALVGAMVDAMGGAGVGDSTER